MRSMKKKSCCNSRIAIRATYKAFFLHVITRNRENIEKELFKALAKRVDGCCRETCPTQEVDLPACGYCITNAQCKSSEKGIFVEVRYFQLLAVDVHEDVKSRYLRQVTEAAEEERAEFDLKEKVKFPVKILRFRFEGHLC